MLRSLTRARSSVGGALLFALALLAGCNDKPPPYIVIFHASGDGDAPMAGVNVLVQGTPGATGPDGAVTFQLLGTEGLMLPVEAHCPDGFRLASQPRPVTLRRIQLLGGEGFAPIEVSVQCVPTQRRIVALVVLGPSGAKLPVYVDEQQVSTTDESGVAHIGLVAPPSRSIRVKVDTSSNEGLIPPNPARTFHVPDHDDIFVFEQKLENTAKPKTEPKAPRRHRRRRSSGGGGPVKL
ncbi:MAG: hypothetical protein R3A78_01695 [Polyangiales bacterium]|nr:hypothetical protein [Myxococcales bacterium]